MAPERPQRPLQLPIEAFDTLIGADDPAAVQRVAHDTAQALLHRVRQADDPHIVSRLVHYTAEHGIGDIAEMWARGSAHSLPGALWRLYLVHEAVSRDALGASYLYRRGLEVDRSPNSAIAGAVEPTGPAEVRELTDRILRGAFEGDFADALDRASAFCAVMSQGAAAVAAGDEQRNSERARVATVRGARYLTLSKELSASARLWRAGRLE